MAQSKTAFEYNFEKGREGEEEVAKFLSSSYHIMPLYQFEKSGTAPYIVGTNYKINSPDLLCWGYGTSMFVEVKTKTRWVTYSSYEIGNKINENIETGCDYNHYKGYKQLSELTNTPLYMVFNHKNNVNGPNGYFMVDIHKEGRYWDGVSEKTNTVVSKPLYFWKYKDLEIIKTY